MTQSMITDNGMEVDFVEVNLPCEAEEEEEVVGEEEEVEDGGKEEEEEEEQQQHELHSILKTALDLIRQALVAMRDRLH